MKKKFVLFISLFSLVMLIIGGFFVINSFSGEKIINLDKVKVKTSKNSLMAYMIQGDNGEYTQSSSNAWPTGDYMLNNEKSGCLDNDGNLIENALTYNIASHNAIVDTDKTSFCYLYFDKLSGGMDILNHLPANSGISDSKLGDMRRYQGSSVKNYICINDDGSKCATGSEQMYRIIGIVDSGPEIGQIKVIKERKYGNSISWNSTYAANSCTGNACAWENVQVYSTLNTTFLATLSEKIQSNIVSREWYYGDLGLDYASIPADQMFQIETGLANTSYYDTSGTLVTDTKWGKTTAKSKIGLMYIHDYAYAANSHATSCYTNYTTCQSSWVHLSQNGNTTGNEWLMSRIGRNKSNTNMLAWYINSAGQIINNHFGQTRVIRPVFYLSNKVKIKSGGTGEASNPYILDLS